MVISDASLTKLEETCMKYARLVEEKLEAGFEDSRLQIEDRNGVGFLLFDYHDRSDMALAYGGDNYWVCPYIFNGANSDFSAIQPEEMRQFVSYVDSLNIL